MVCFTEASLSSKNVSHFRTESKDTWNPKNDAVYDPETGFCYFEDYSSHRFLPSSLETMEKIRSAFSSVEAITTNENSPINNTRTSPEHTITTTDYISFSSPSSRETTLSARSTPSPFKSSNLHVPEKCRSFERKWDFYLGNPEEDTDVIGWVSRIGFADNIINELELPTRNASYTLLPHGYNSKPKLWHKLNESRYIELTFHNYRLFHNLYAISSKVDSHLRSVILAININFDKDKNVCVKIFVDAEKDMNGGAEPIYWQLVQMYPFISYYKKY